jgi:hypothetical protein
MKLAANAFSWHEFRLRPRRQRRGQLPHDSEARAKNEGPSFEGPFA